MVSIDGSTYTTQCIHHHLKSNKSFIDILCLNWKSMATVRFPKTNESFHYKIPLSCEVDDLPVLLVHTIMVVLQQRILCTVWKGSIPGTSSPPNNPRPSEYLSNPQHLENTHRYLLACSVTKESILIYLWQCQIDPRGPRYFKESWFCITCYAKKEEYILSKDCVSCLKERSGGKKEALSRFQILEISSSRASAFFCCFWFMWLDWRLAGDID